MIIKIHQGKNKKSDIKLGVEGRMYRNMFGGSKTLVEERLKRGMQNSRRFRASARFAEQEFHCFIRCN
jgi:hypothetical protein